MSKLSFYCLIYLLPQICFGFLNGKLGRLDLSSSISGSYDSNLFGVSKDEFQILKNTKDIESDDDFIIKFSPVVHYSKKVSLLNFGVNAGFELAEYIFNNNRSYLIPTTDIILDFDDTLSKSKTFSNNSKIRFSANFDIGQNIGTDLIDYICDTTKEKIGKFSPGTHIPIVPVNHFKENIPDVAFLFAWNHKEEIFLKEKEFKDNGGVWFSHVTL